MATLPFKKKIWCFFEKINGFISSMKSPILAHFYQLKIYFDVYIYVINLSQFFDLKGWFIDHKRLRVGYTYSDLPFLWLETIH